MGGGELSTSAISHNHYYRFLTLVAWIIITATRCPMVTRNRAGMRMELVPVPPMVGARGGKGPKREEWEGKGYELKVAKQQGLSPQAFSNLESPRRP